MPEAIVFAGATASYAAHVETDNPGAAQGATGDDHFMYDAIALTPEMILALVRRRLANADGQITAVMDTIDASNQRSELYARRQQLILALRGKVQGDHGANRDREFHLSEFFDEGSNTIKIGDETKTLDEWMDATGMNREMLGIDNESGMVTMNGLEDALERVKQDARTEASGSEMNMLQLQQLMQQRSQIIQLGTNLSKKISEGESAIVNNMR